MLSLVHMWLGLISATFILFITITGIALNHSDDLNLSETYVANSLIIDLYDFDQPNITSFTANKTLISFDSINIYANGTALGKCQQLIGAQSWRGNIIAACQNQLIAIDHRLQVIDIIDQYLGLPTPVTQAYVANDSFIVVANNIHYQANLESLLFHKIPTPDIAYQPQLTSATPSKIRSQIERHYSSNLLLWDQLLRDLHSYRFLGPYGVIIADIIAIILVLVILIGCYRAITRLHKIRKRKKSYLI